MTDVDDRLLWRTGVRLCGNRFGIRTKAVDDTPVRLSRVCNRTEGHRGGHCDHAGHTCACLRQVA